jgi:hypothetical protein
MDAFDRARMLIDEAHAADPSKAPDGRPAELAYADNVERWIVRIEPGADQALRLAARCQHLERWAVPRTSFPEGRDGYFSWRRSLYVRQAEGARRYLSEAGVSPSVAADIAIWVSKTGLKTNPGTQALEDAAVLVFLETEVEAFHAQHAEYPREKFIDILKKTWRKMSPRAQELALTLELPASVAPLVREAVLGH